MSNIITRSTMQSGYIEYVGFIQSTPTISQYILYSRYNVRITKYRDGTPIPHVSDPTEWANLSTGAWCYYNNDPKTAKTYGLLYNWYAVDNFEFRPPIEEFLASTPSGAEWSFLTNHLGGDSLAGGKMKEVSTQYWLAPNLASTDIGFNAIPYGIRNANGTFSNDISSSCYFWTSDEVDINNGRAILLQNNSITVNRPSIDKRVGMAVRWILGYVET